MFLTQITVNFLLFFSSLFGMILNRRNLLIFLMCIELFLLFINLNFIFSAVYLDDLYGEIFALFILTVAAAESATGLALVIVYYNLRNSIVLNQKQLLRY
jgi:NADH-quinone oxidoreductase subunit K